jgi:hypothetical protein
MNAWVNHVRQYAKAHNITYGCAVANPDCKSSYKNVKTTRSEKQSREVEMMGVEDVIAGEVRFEENFSKMLRNAERREAIRLGKISLKAKRDNNQVLSQLIPAVLKRRERINMMLEDKIASEIRFEEKFATMLQEAEAKNIARRQNLKPREIKKTVPFGLSDFS